MHLTELLRCACVQLLLAGSISGVKLSPSEAKLEVAKHVTTYRTGVSTKESTGSVAAPSVAVLISGQLFRFVLQDSFKLKTTNLKSWICGDCRLDFHIVLADSNFTGHEPDCDMRIPYANTKEDISKFYKSRGADNVTVKIVSEDEMARQMSQVHELVGTMGAKVMRTTPESLWQQLEALQSPKKVNAWTEYQADNNMFWLRHEAYASALAAENEQLEYSHFLYVRDDNSFVHPDEFYMMGDLIKDVGPGDVIVDQYCGFGSYSDKMYLAGRLGADLLFAPDLQAHCRHMAWWSTFALRPNDRPTRCDFVRSPYGVVVRPPSPVQSECWLQELLEHHSVDVSEFDFHRTDLRYHRGESCAVKLYKFCTAAVVYKDLAICRCEQTPPKN